MNYIIHPTFLPNIAHFVAMMYIYGANGKLALNIPVAYSQKNRQKYRDVQIANTSNWQDIHWKSILSAYRTSPFFEFYEDDLSPLFKTKKYNLYDFNIECIDVISSCLDLEFNYTKTEEFKKEYTSLDYRNLVKAKKEPNHSLKAYTQVFNEKHGFIPNLSILDLLFNEGPNAVSYLEAQSL